MATTRGGGNQSTMIRHPEMDKDATMNSNFDENSLKELISNLKKQSVKNAQQRAKFSDDPEKFADSETEIFALLDELRNVASQTELYRVLIDSRFIITLLELLKHENNDISAKVITLIKELLSVGVDQEMEDATNDLAEEFTENHDLRLELVDNLYRFRHYAKDEADAINNSIDIIRCIIDDHCYSPKGAFSLNYLDWAVKHIKKNQKFNPIKLSLIELLNVLLYAGINTDAFYEVGGVGALLKQIAHYRKNSPSTMSEREYLYQVFACLSSALMDDMNPQKKAFFDEEGIELMELILREKGEAARKSLIKYEALKTLSLVLTNMTEDGDFVTMCAEKFVEVLGLRVLFPIFNRPKLIIPPSVKKLEAVRLVKEIEEQSISIILSLLKNVKDTVMIQRILIKFAENEYEKFKRLIKLHKKYYESYKKLSDEYESNKIEKLADRADRAHFNLTTTDYTILLTCYLSINYETYDPKSGEKFTACLKKILAEYPELKSELLDQGRKHLEEVKTNSEQEANSLQLLIELLESQ